MDLQRKPLMYACMYVCMYAERCLWPVPSFQCLLSGQSHLSQESSHGNYPAYIAWMYCMYASSDTCCTSMNLVYMNECIHIYICLNVCRVCMYICMHACMYVYICMYVWTLLFSSLIIAFNYRVCIPSGPSGRFLWLKKPFSRSTECSSWSAWWTSWPRW